jgi:hypothetical protein
MAVEPEGSRLVSHSKGDGAESLRWYAGYQPILLPLPEGRRVTSLGWLSVFDHQIRVSNQKKINTNYE